MSNDIEAAADMIQAKAGFDPIDIAILLGTGHGGAADGVENAVTFAYEELPGFPKLTISGHDGKLVIGTLEGVRIAFLVGRSHYYEHGNPRAMAVPIETMAMLGVQTIIITNSAGSVNADLFPGNLCIITDHINFSGLNPLVGAAQDGGFVNLTEAYDKRLLRRMKLSAAAGGVPLREGVYMWFSGPSFETPAEVKMAKLLGADLVGMSTVPEVILARRLALKVVAISIISNFAAGFSGGNPSHMETREVAQQGAIGLRRLLRAFLRSRDTGNS